MRRKSNSLKMINDIIIPIHDCNIQTKITYADIKPVLAKWWNMSANNLIENSRQIIQELTICCGGQQNLDYITDFLTARTHNGCKLSKIILNELTLTTTAHKVRKTQFAQQVNARDGWKCVLTGNHVGIQAAHILDFAECLTDTERYDSNNGLTLDMKIHYFWDTGLIICVPDCDTNTARFQISEINTLSSETHTEIQYALKSTKDAISIPMSDEMSAYIIMRYNLDCERFKTTNQNQN